MRMIGRARCVRTGRRWTIWELEDGTVKVVKEKNALRS